MEPFDKLFKKDKKVVIENNTTLRGYELEYACTFYSRVDGSSGTKTEEKKFIPLTAYKNKKREKESFHEIEFTIYAFKDDKIYVHFSLNDYVLDAKSPRPSSWKYGHDDGYSASQYPVIFSPVYK